MLEEANDESKPLALRAARAYLDVCRDAFSDNDTPAQFHTAI